MNYSTKIFTIHDVSYLWVSAHKELTPVFLLNPVFYHLEISQLISSYTLFDE